MKPWPVFAAALLLSGCATYRPLPLDLNAQAPARPGDIKINAAELSLPGLGTHVFDPRNGLDMTEVAQLAVANNPQLKLARDASGVARAQAFAAGLLPDPVLAVGPVLPVHASDGNTTGFNLGLSYDVAALITHGAAQRAAHDTLRKVDLDLLWQEWQVIGQARRLFIQAVYEHKAVALLAQELTSLQRYHQGLSDAYRRGDVSLQRVSQDDTRLQLVRNRFNALQRAQVVTGHALNALLGLSPHARLDLVGSFKIAIPGKTQIQLDLRRLPHRRPDLLALEAGYQSQDERYREAILRQFPAIQIGVQRNRDTSDVNTYGFGLSVSLPLFNRNRGAVAVGKATRQRLYDQYSARLLAARSAIDRILKEQPILERQRLRIAHDLAATRQTYRAAKAAYAHADVSDRGYVAAQKAWLDNSLALLGIDRVIAQQRAALHTLLGGRARTR